MKMFVLVSCIIVSGFFIGCKSPSSLPEYRPQPVRELNTRPFIEQQGERQEQQPRTTIYKSPPLWQSW
jgi:hypothetical protein